MKSRTINALMVMAIFLLGTGVQAATLAVPSRYSTIESALANSAAGDVVEISPGTYTEHDLVVPEGVTIIGTGAIPQDVLIDGNEEGRLLLLESLSQLVTIRNLTFLRGHAQGLSSYDQSGGALLISNSNALVENCVFSVNTADSHGGAIRCINSSPEITACKFYGNSAPDGGGGAIDMSYNSSPQVTDGYFLANRADWGGALSCRGGASPRVENCDLVGNAADGVRGFGGGVFADHVSSPDLLLTTVTDNEARFGGGLASYPGGPINLDYCTVVNNTAWILEGGVLVVDSAPFITGSIVAFNDGSGIAVAGDQPIRISCTDVYGNSAGDGTDKIKDLLAADDNLSVDPQFCSLSKNEADRFHLSSNSPLAQADSPCGILGALPVSCTGEKVEDQVPVVSSAIEKVAAAPNPFNPQTVVSFELGLAQEVRVSVYGVDGRLIQILSEGMLNVGSHALVWNGRDRSGRTVSSGTYFVMVQGREDKQRLKVTMLK